MNNKNQPQPEPQEASKPGPLALTPERLAAAKKRAQELHEWLEPKEASKAVPVVDEAWLEEAFYELVSPGLSSLEIAHALEWFKLGARASQPEPTSKGKLQLDGTEAFQTIGAPQGTPKAVAFNAGARWAWEKASQQQALSEWYRVFKDGNAWCAVGPGFVNIQESLCAFHDESPYRALELLTEAEAEEKRRAHRAILAASSGSKGGGE